MNLIQLNKRLDELENKILRAEEANQKHLINCHKVLFAFFYRLIKFYRGELGALESRLAEIKTNYSDPEEQNTARGYILIKDEELLQSIGLAWDRLKESEKEMVNIFITKQNRLLTCDNLNEREENSRNITAEFFSNLELSSIFQKWFDLFIDVEWERRRWPVGVTLSKDEENTLINIYYLLSKSQRAMLDEIYQNDIINEVRERSQKRYATITGDDVMAYSTDEERKIFLKKIYFIGGQDEYSRDS